MKTIITTIISLLFTCAASLAQVNLVLNPSLEQHVQCPIAVDEIRYANSWMSLDSSFYPDPPLWLIDTPGVPDYCNVCSSDSSINCAVPANVRFYHYARTGNGMAQVQMFDNEYFGSMGQQLRDYLQGHLSTPLVAGQSYCVTFYVVQELTSVYHINNIGAYLDDGSIDTTVNPGFKQTEYVPQIIEHAIISDTLNWTKIQGSFVANGTERLITIGNFSDTAHMDFVPVYDTSNHHCVCSSGPGASWYLVDDVSVIRSDATPNAGPDKTIAAAGDTVLIGDTLDSYVPTYWYANGAVIDSNKSGIFVHPDSTTAYVVGLQLCGNISYDTVVVHVAADTTHHDSVSHAYVQPLQYNKVRVYPNPAQNNITIEQAKGCRWQLYNAVGEQALSNTIYSNREAVDIQTLAPGIYLLQLTDPVTGYKVKKKVLKE